jgi:hypothetical protein
MMMVEEVEDVDPIDVQSILEQSQCPEQFIEISQ